jgi:hypothetical protein
MSGLMALTMSVAQGCSARTRLTSRAVTCCRYGSAVDPAEVRAHTNILAQLRNAEEHPGSFSRPLLIRGSLVRAQSGEPNYYEDF